MFFVVVVNFCLFVFLPLYLYSIFCSFITKFKLFIFFFCFNILTIIGTKECGIPGPNIGYMPQELSLITQFTVRETLEYYAGFAKQTSHMQPLESRIEFLLKLLDISDFEHCYTDRLSGGQQRRVSLAVAMINEPPLLILDEPTVGVDPIVRESIWSYLVDQSKNGLTVCI